jgi:gliding motility-associated-like protein
MKKIVFLLCCFALFKTATAQPTTCPPNIDFESGDFSFWQCMIGSTRVQNGQNVINLSPSDPVKGRHEIITATGAPQLDFYGKFPMLCPYGGGMSVKLGNEQVGSQAEGLSYTFTVPTTVDTFTFTYFYAVVFEDPNHAHYEQPRFFVTAYDVATGLVVNCASFDYVSNGTIPGFEVSPVRNNVLFKRWSPASLQFAGLAGHTVRLEFKTADCTLGGHFGYAYVDVGSACSNILATAPYCVETNSLVLNAPYGFQTYTWYNQDYSAIIGQSQSLTLSPPPATSGVFNVDVIPYPGYGCRDTLQAVVTPLPIPDTPVAPVVQAYCQGQASTPLMATASPGHEVLWYTSATGGTGTNIPPTPSTQNIGETYYYVAQKALFGCESQRKKITVKVTSSPVAAFSINGARQCLNGNQYIFTSTSTNLDDAGYVWDFGDGKGVTATSSIANYTYEAAGNFTVKLKVTNAGKCAAEKTLPVTLVPKPVADLSYPSIICEKQTQVTLTDRSSVPGGADIVTKWWWSVDGVVSQVQNPAGFIANKPGQMPVKLVVTSSEGCVSDTNSINLPVRYKPGAAFRYTDRLCDNEVIQFTDLSAMPAGATGENIVKWSWQLDNTINFGAQNPATMLAPGAHTASLVTETNFGCRTQSDTVFTVNSKPLIQLVINDSCVFRPIRYSASDMLNSTDKWLWDMGNGFYRDGASISRTYSKEGYHPLTLIGETDKGCRDTIFRPFTIFDNDAFAGRDTVVAKDEPVQLNARGVPGMRYLWSPSTGLNDATIENPIATLDRNITYTLETWTKEGCDSRSQVFIKRYAGPDIYIPNAFTPNNDRVNDLFKVVPIGIKSFNYLVIYNRWGQVVFRTTDQHQGWDGTYQGVQLPSGTFVAVSQAVDYKGQVMLRKRTVMLIR